MPKTSGRDTPILDPFDPFRSEERVLKRFLKAADRFDAKHGRTKAAARRQLEKEGVVTRSGRLTKRFGG